MRSSRHLFALTASALIALTAGTVAGGQASPGVGEKTIVIGQAAALRGQASSLGEGMRAGLNAYFTRVNNAGGIHGRTIDFKSLDDGYEPDQSERVTRVLIDKMNVFALIGAVGTPTSVKTVPIAKETGVPFVAPFTGAGFLRDSGANPHVINIRASYDQEMEALATYLVDQKGLTKIACFYQNDAYGKVGLSGIEKALARRNMKLVSTGTYERNTVAIAGGLAEVANGQPEAVVMVGAYTGCAAFIKSARQNPVFASTVFCNISFVGTDALRSALGSDGAGVIVSQVVPFPWDMTVPVIADFHKDMAASGSGNAIGYISLEGYLAGKMFCAALEKAGAQPTRQAVQDAFYGMSNQDLGGLSVSFGPGDNQGMDQVYLTELTADGIKPIGTGAFANVILKD